MFVIWKSFPTPEIFKEIDRFPFFEELSRGSTVTSELKFLDFVADE